MHPSSPKLVLGLAQMAHSEDPAANLERAVEMVRRAAARGAKVVCLDELFRSRYFCQKEDAALFDLAEAIPGPTTGALSPLAAELGVVIIAPVFERRAPGVYHNSAAVIDADGRLLGTYRKMHIPDDPLYYEKFYFTPGDAGGGGDAGKGDAGDEGYRVFDTRAGRLGVLICWDQWYPEAARLTALRGAEVLLYPTAIGWHPGEKAREGAAQREAWMTIQRAHAVANGVFVAAVNRVGYEGPAGGVPPAGGGIEFWGTSFVADPFGRLLAEGPVDREEVLVVECDRARIEAVRRGWPFLRDRRVDSYGPITRRLIDGS